MSGGGRLEEWRRRLDGCVPGELSVREWCRRQGVSEYQYHYWRRRVAASPRDGGWLCVDVVQTPASVSGGVSVHVAGASIQVQAGFDPAMLRAVVRALQAPSC
jgi:hypothetical protein